MVEVTKPLLIVANAIHEKSVAVLMPLSTIWSRFPHPGHRYTRTFLIAAAPLRALIGQKLARNDFRVWGMSRIGVSVFVAVADPSTL